MNSRGVLSLALAASLLAAFASPAPLAAGSAPGEETWWSLQPIKRPEIPSVPGNDSKNPIDAFIRARLLEKGLPSSPQAARRTLIRRLYFDLIGLPPTPEETARFASDDSPGAYERLVDQLLSSPHYGERWARHWLDVVHYGDTHGYDKDQPRPNAWPYRDYVIRSFNADKPYSRFIQEQLAGDVLFGTGEAIEALGFISAGPWDLIGHAEVPETKTDGKIARHLDRDDMVATTMSTFNSFTVHCAQCHDHKFDPIPIEDYYNLQSVFAALDRTNREYYDERELNRKLASLKSGQREFSSRKRELERKISEIGGEEWKQLAAKLDAAAGAASIPPQYGYHSAIESRPDSPKWVQVDLGEPVEIEKVVLAPCWDDFAGIGAGFGFPPQFKIEASNDPKFESTALIHDQSAALANPGTALQTYPASAKARFVRVTATQLAPRQNDYIFALAELQVFDSEGKNRAAGAEVTSLDSTEAPIRWTRRNLVDGLYPALEGVPEDRTALEAQLAALFKTKIPAPTRQEWHEATNRLAEIEAALAEMPEPKVAYVGSVHYGSGAFRGTGPDGGRPRPIYVLARGDVRQPTTLAVPGALSAVKALPSTFDLPEGHPEGARRAALARWLSDPRNPLTWRSIVNRVWQYHFGRGLVDTPNDFGRMGALPTHPRLLDWLAIEFRDGGQSIKTLHKLIVTSAAYKQTSAITPETASAAAIDGDNQFLWRMNRRKLEAELIRDAVLFASGKLDLRMFGPGFQDFVVEKPEHSPHYQYHLHDPDDPATHRRAIYRFIVRSQPQPFMATLDCADPSMLVAQRNESLSALQALALLNNPFMVTMASHFAERAESLAPTLQGQVDAAIAIALSRPPSEIESRELLAYAREHGLPNACRLIFNLNEFIFVD